MGRLRNMAVLGRDPYGGLEQLYRREGQVCEVGFKPLRAVYLFGPEANEFVLANGASFSWREAFRPILPIVGETALIVSDGEDHRRRRKLVQPAFTRRQVLGYVEGITANVDRVVDSWRVGQTVDLYTEMRQAIRRTTVEVLFGGELAADEAVLGTGLQRALDLMDQHPALVPLRPVLPSYRRARAGRAAVARRVRAEITRRVAGGDDRPDTLGALLAAGGAEEEVVDQVISLMAAGYETTSAAMAWALRDLLRDNRVLERARDDEPYLEWVVAESLRLHPPAAIVPRWPLEPLEFAGRTIAPGTVVIISPYLTHRLPELWPDPLAFRPERWDPADPDHRRPAPHEYFPFGFGAHRCIGAPLAEVELRTLLGRFLRRASVRLLVDDPAAINLAAMRPRGGLPVEVTGLA